MEVQRQTLLNAQKAIVPTAFSSNIILKMHMLSDGAFFRKLKGDRVYKKMAKGSVVRMKLDSDFQYGMDHLGEITKIPPGTRVKLKTCNDFASRHFTDDAWNRLAG